MLRELNLPDGVWFLYELKLQHGYHYIGITTSIMHRMSMHKSGKGSRVTREHKPMELVAVYRIGFMSYSEAENYEDAYTLMKAAQHGKKWRGGRYCLGCNSKAAERILEGIDEKYKQSLPQVKVSYRFRKNTRKSKRAKSSPWAKQEKKARGELKRSSRQRFGCV